MNTTTPRTIPAAQEGPAINHTAEPRSSRVLLRTPMDFSPRGTIAFSFLNSFEWLGTKLRAAFRRSMPIQAGSLDSLHYRHRQIS
jgi:hypothetical protein